MILSSKIIVLEFEVLSYLVGILDKSTGYLVSRFLACGPVFRGRRLVMKGVALTFARSRGSVRPRATKGARNADAGVGEPFGSFGSFGWPLVEWIRLAEMERCFGLE